MMIIPLLVCNMLMFVMYCSITDTIDLIIALFFTVGTGAIIYDMIENQKRIPQGFGFIGVLLMILGFLFLITGGDMDNFMMSMAFITGGFWIAYFASAKTKPESKNIITHHRKPVQKSPKVLIRSEKNVEDSRMILERPEPKVRQIPKKIEETPEMVPVLQLQHTEIHEQKSRTFETGLSGLFRRVLALASVRSNQAFYETLSKTHALYHDLQGKGVHVSELLTDQMRKLLIEYLDLDDDPVQTEKTIEVKRQVQEAFTPICQVLEKLYDQYISSRQMDLETDVQSLEMKLRMDGLLDSDFQMNFGQTENH